MNSFDIKMLEKAKELAKKSTYGTHRLGCILVYKHRIISMAVNTNKTHPMQKTYNMLYREFTKSDKPILDLGHAEILAINSIPYPIAQRIDWSKVRLYVARNCRGKEFGMARPCDACAGLIRDMGIKRVFYTTDEGYAEERYE